MILRAADSQIFIRRCSPSLRAAISLFLLWFFTLFSLAAIFLSDRPTSALFSLPSDWESSFNVEKKIAQNNNNEPFRNFYTKKL